MHENGDPYEGELKPEICGNTLPTWYGGWNNYFEYKGFDLTVFFQFSGGNKIYNGTKATVSDMRNWNNSKDVLNNYWTPEIRMQFILFRYMEIIYPMVQHIQLVIG